MKITGGIFLIFTLTNANLIQGRAIGESDEGVAANGIIKDIQEDQLKQRQSKQDEDAAPSQSQSTGLIPVTPIGQIIQNVVPNAQEAVVSILKGVSSPFEFISKYVDNYINPTTTSTVAPPPPPKKTNVLSLNSGSFGGGNNGHNGITLVLIPASEPVQSPVQAPVGDISPVKIAASPSTDSNEEEEENEESVGDTELHKLN